MSYIICGTRFDSDAFRLEDQDGPEADELAAFHRWLDRDPLLPSRWPEWQSWLTRVQEMTRTITLTRVVLLDSPPTEYQQWRQWGTPWHLQAGEKILFMSRQRARELGIPAGNWWVFDRDTITTIDGTRITGRLTGKYHAGRDLAITHAVETITA